MEKHTVAVSVNQLHVPYWIDPDAHEHVKSLISEKCDGGNGEYDKPADTLLRQMFNRNIVVEWEAIDITSVGFFTVFEELRIVFKAVA